MFQARSKLANTNFSGHAKTPLLIRSPMLRTEVSTIIRKGTNQTTAMAMRTK